MRFLFISYQHVAYQFRDSKRFMYMKIITFLHVIVNPLLAINAQNEFKVSFIRILSEHKVYLIAKQIRN